MILESILAFFGLIIGLILAKYTKEEFKSGKKYFLLFYKLILFIIILTLLYFVQFNWMLVGFLIGMILAYFFRNLYFYLGLAYFGSLNIYIAFLIFLVGLPYGTILYHQRFKRKILVYFILFFISSLITLIVIPETLLFSFVAGALFLKFLKFNSIF